MGGLVGQAMYGGSTINSSASGNVTATGNYVGGLVGQAINGSSTSNSSASGNVTATGTGNYVGGLIGQAYNSSGLSNSSASGNVNSSGNYVGGLIGQAFNSSSTSNSSASGTVSGNSSVGGLVGETDSGSAISNSGASGAVSGSTNVGGLVGLANGPVSRSYATAQVTSQGGIVGGLVGLMDGSTAVFTDVFASGDVTSSNAIAGGLAGKLDNGARLTRAYASGTVVSGTKGGLVGLVTSGLVTDGYFNSTANSGTGASNTSIGMTGLSNANAFTANNYSGFTFTSASADAGSTTDNRWVMVNADGSLVTSAGSTSASAVRPLLAGTWRTGIADAVGLQLMSLKLNDSYTLANNIDASATGRAVDGSGNAGVWGAAGFVPVGVNNTDMMSVSVVPFSGSLNGQYHRLSGLTVVTSYALAGLIGKLDTAGSVSAIGLIDASITGTGSTNIVDAGALVGFNLGSVRDSLATGTVRSSGSTSNIGGLVGYQMDPGSITSSMAAVNVSSTVATNGAWLGGLVGALDGSNTAITDSYATGTVSLVNSASGDAAGGLSGYSSGTISNSFATGAVNAAGTANGSYDALVGDQSGGTTTNSVASGWVKGAAVSGGTSGAAMQQAATFGGLNLDTTWKIYEGHTTPLLRNWLTPLTVTVNYTGPTATGPNSQQYNATTNYAGGVGTSYSLTTADSSLVQGNLAALSSKNVGAPTVGADLYSSQLGYLITPVLTGNTSVNVTAAPLQVSGLTAVGKTYDTNVVASITGTAAVTALGSDVVTLGGTAAGAFADKNVGIAKAVTVTGVALSGSGADNGNYNLLQQTGLTATISKADLAVTGLTASDKTYNTNTTATLGGTAAVTALSGDVVTLGGTAAGAFADKNAGIAKAVTVTGVALSGSGADNGNYNLLQQTGLTATISKADLAVTGLTASDKTYNTNTTATLGGTAAVTALSGDVVALGGTASATFADKNAGIAKAVTVTGVTLSGADNANYNLLQATGLTATISKADLAVTGLTASDKVYDANTTATLGGIAAVTALSGDVVTLGGTASATFADKNAGTAKAVTVTGVTLSGADNANYNLVQQTGLTASISKADLAVTGLTASAKVYDANTTAALTGSATVTALGSDVVTLGGAAIGAFADKNAGTAKAVTVTGVTLSGADNANYNLVQQTGLTASISKADLAVTGLTASAKVYDANTTAALTGSATVTALGSDVVTLGGAAIGAFADKNAGTAKAVTVTGNTISGTDVGNYNLLQATGLTASISKADLAVTGLSASAKVYDASTTAALTGSAAVTALGSDVVTLGGTAAGAFADKNAGTAKAVTASGVTLSGTDVGNYNLLQATGLTASISKADLAVTGLIVSDKTYNANTTATLSGTAGVTALGSDVVTLGGTAAGVFADKNAGTAKAVTASGNTISGTDAGNYNLLQQTGLTASISKADLAVTGLAASAKTYNANTTATLSGTAGVTALGSDVVTLGGTAAGVFADKNAGTAKAVTASGNTISGTDAGNYNLVQQTGLTASVSKADLAVTGLAASAKVYDANTTATLGGTASVTALGSDVVTLGGTAAGAFADKNAGTAKAVTVTGNTISGTDAGNYNLVQQTGLTASVSKADLAVTGLAASAKVYDANTTATLGGTASVTALGSDVVTLGGTAAGVFADKNAGTAKAVTASGNTISGTDAGNYNLVQQTGLTASVSKADLAVTGLAASAKVYDANTTATLGGTASVTALGSDVVTLGGTAAGAFADKNAGTAKAVTVTGNTISGTDAGNYELLQQAGLTATIRKAQLSYTATPATFLNGQTPNGLSGAVNGFVTGDSLANSTSGSLTWTTPANANSQPGSYAIDGSALVAANYSFSQAAPNATALTLTPAPATAQTSVLKAITHVTSQTVLSQAIALSVFPPIKVIQSNNVETADTNTGATSKPDNVASINTSMTIGTTGPTLQIVNGGMRLPLAMVNVNE